MAKISKRRLRAGFGLLELVVLMVIIFMLVALSLPLIDQAQEAARRNACGIS